MFTVYAKNINPIPGREIQNENEEVELFTIPTTDGNPRPFLTAQVNVELGNAGSFEFSVDPKSPLADIWLHMRTLVRVEYDGETIFYGRVLTIDRDLYRTRKIHCEGAYTFFMDSVFEGQKNGYTITLSEYIQKLIDAHNECMTDVPEKQIFAGEIPGNYSQSIVDEQKIQDETQKYAASKGYKATKNWLDELVSDYGGFMRVRYNGTDGKMYLDWMKTYFNATESNQHMSVSSNAVDLSDTVEVNNIFTHVIPVGKDSKYLDGGSQGGSGGSGRHTVTVTNVYEPPPVGGVPCMVYATPNDPSAGVKVTLTLFTNNGSTSGYYIDHFIVKSGGVTIDNKNQFIMGDSNVLIQATLRKIDEGGGIDPGEPDVDPVV